MNITKSKNFINKDTVIIFLLLIITFGYFYLDSGYNGNTRFGLTFRLVEEGRLDLNTLDIENQNSPLFTGDVASYNGSYYTDKAIGSSLLAAIPYAPIYWITKLMGFSLAVETKKHLLTFLALGIPSAICGALIYWLCEFLSRNRIKALLITVFTTLGTMLLPYSVTFFGHVQAGALLFSAFVLIFSIARDPQHHLYDSRTFLIGLLLGMAFMVEYPTALLILPLIFYYFYALAKVRSLKEIKHYLYPLIGGFIPLALIATYNLKVYGVVFASGYEHLVDTYFRTHMSEGLMGISLPNLDVLFYETLHPAQGLFWLSPVLLLVPVGAWIMFRDKQYRLELCFALYAAAAMLIMNSGYYMWWGGNSLGPRAVIPMLPFMCIPLIFVPRRWTPILILLGAVSVAQMLLASACQFLIPGNFIPTIATDPFFSYSNIFSNVLVQLKDHRFGWNIGQNLLGLKTWWSLLPLLCCQLLFTLLFFWKKEITIFSMRN